MTSQARIDANRINAQASTGPRTPEGRARCSGNAATLGLFSARAFVRPGETDEYEQLRSGLMAELAPRSLMEQAHATEILNSMWRLLRCSLVEAEMADQDLLSDSTTTDPMASQATLPTQNAVDRARAHAGNTIRRSTTELRRLQTERMLQSQLGTNEGLASHKDAAGTLVSEARRALLMRKLDDLHTVEGTLEALFSGNSPAPITKQTQGGCPAYPTQWAARDTTSGQQTQSAAGETATGRQTQTDPQQDPEASIESFFEREAENLYSQAITKQTHGGCPAYPNQWAARDIAGGRQSQPDPLQDPMWGKVQFAEGSSPTHSPSTIPPPSHYHQTEPATETREGCPPYDTQWAARYIATAPQTRADPPQPEAGFESSEDVKAAEASLEYFFDREAEALFSHFGSHNQAKPVETLIPQGFS